MLYDLQQTITCNRQLLVVRMNLFPKMPHQNTGLRKFFLTQVNTVDLSPIKNYNFGWGPNFVESPSSLVHIVRLATDNYLLFG